MQGPLRIIFSVTVLLLWVLFGIGLATGAWTSTQWLMLALGHLACAVIFVHFIWVFNYGYGLTVTVNALALLALMPSPAAALVGGIAAAFGLRMLQFTRARYRAASYAASVERQRQASDALPLAGRITMWILVSWLMAFELMPLWFVARSGELTGSVVAGALLMLAGLLLETVADTQKQASKARNPAAFVSDGLFRYVRHPNYLGEIVFQAGLIASCLGAVSGWWEAAVAVLAPAYVIVLMAYAGRDADGKAQERYGADAAYQRYRTGSGRFLPGL